MGRYPLQPPLSSAVLKATFSRAAGCVSSCCPCSHGRAQHAALARVLLMMRAMQRAVCLVNCHLPECAACAAARACHLLVLCGAEFPPLSCSSRCWSSSVSAAGTSRSASLPTEPASSRLRISTGADIETALCILESAPYVRIKP